MPSSLLFPLLMILAMFFWGAGWTALKILTESVSVDILTFWRFLLMSLSFIPILFFFRQPLILPKKGIKYVLGSTILNILFMLCAYLGVEASGAGNGGVIITVMSPMFTFVLSLYLLKQKHTKTQYLGLLIGLVGGIIMLRLYDPSHFIQGGEIYFIYAAAIWAGVTLLAQRSHLHIHPIHYSFFISVTATLVLFALTVKEDLGIVFRQDETFWISLIYLSIFGQTIATTIFFVASGRIGSAKASSYMFLVPLFALLVSYFVLDEAIEHNIIIGGMISLISVYFINKRSKS